MSQGINGIESLDWVIFKNMSELTLYTDRETLLKVFFYFDKMS